MRKTTMEMLGVKPVFDHNYKLLGKYARLFEEVDVYPLLKVKKGWSQLLDQLSLAIDHYTQEKKIPGFRFLSVTEQNGQLVINHTGIDPVIEGMIEQATLLSQRTCVECGKPSNNTTGFSPLCETHAFAANIGNHGG